MLTVEDKTSISYITVKRKNWVGQWPCHSQGCEPVRWVGYIYHYCLCRMASATPDLRFPSQPHSITAFGQYQIMLLGNEGTCV